MTKYSILDLFGYIHEAFCNVAVKLSEIYGLDITGQIGAADTFIVVKTNKHDCVWAPCCLCVYSFSTYFISILYNVILFIGILNIH